MCVPIHTIRSVRLDLLAGSEALLKTELDAPAKLSMMLGAKVPASWPCGEYDRDAIAFFHEQLRQGGPSVSGWYSWYVLHRQGSERALVGAAGFFGPPQDGVVEIGFSIAPEWQRQGFASEAVDALCRRAAQYPVHLVRARTTPDNEASKLVLAACGFKRQEFTEDGMMLFLKTIQPSASG